MITQNGSTSNTTMSFVKGKLRKGKRFIWMLTSIVTVCAIYFLFVLREDEGHARAISLIRLSQNGIKEKLECPADSEFDASINKTVYGNPIHDKERKVVYVSVPKCGSRTFVWILWELKNQNNISNIVDLPYMLDDDPVDQMKAKLGGMLQSAPPASFFHGHVRFIEFTDPTQMPVYISMIRDPLSRHMSWFYFMRYGDGDMNDLKKLRGDLKLGPGSASVNETYDDCVQKNRNDCTYSYYVNMNIKMFCGYEKKCVDSPEYALAQAKRNLDRFLFVGMVEEYNDTLQVMEQLLPSMLKGTFDQYLKNRDKFFAMSKTAFKKTPEPKTVEIMKERLKYDYEFYYYVQERFHKLKRRLGIGPC